jgi:hypothetical protein
LSGIASRKYELAWGLAERLLDDNVSARTVYNSSVVCSYPDHSTVLYIYPWGQKKKVTLYLSSLAEFVLPIALDSPIDTDANDFKAHAVAIIAPSCKFPSFEG